MVVECTHIKGARFLKYHGGSTIRDVPVRLKPIKQNLISEIEEIK